MRIVFSGWLDCFLKLLPLSLPSGLVQARTDVCGLRVTSCARSWFSSFVCRFHTYRFCYIWDQVPGRPVLASAAVDYWLSLNLTLGSFLGNGTPHQNGSGIIADTVISICDLAFVCAVV